MALAWPDPLPTSGPVRLRPYADTDLPLVAALSGDPYVPLIGSVPADFTEAAGLAYLARQQQRLVEGAGWSYAVALLDTDEAVGGAGLWLHDRAPATAGYVIAPDRRGQGLATAALTALTRFAADVVGLDRVELYVEPANTASLVVADRCGYRSGALVRGHSEIGGERRDMVRLAWTADSGETNPS